MKLSSVETNICGHSGCKLTLCQKGTDLVISKSSSDINYIPRLRKQIEIQRNFSESNSLDFVRVPRVLNEALTSEQYIASMEYLRLLDFAEFLEVVGPTQIQTFVQKLIFFIEHLLHKSPNRSIPSSVFYDKIQEIRKKLSLEKLAKTEKHLQALENEAISQDWLHLPIGDCHGDLTLSNIVISRDGSQFGIFDFLDSYISSPLLDVAKIRQDTCFGWSLRLLKGNFDPVRLQQGLDYIDKQIDQHFLQLSAYRNYYCLLQGINIARIMPYSRNEATFEYLLNVLSELGY